jgi:pyruvate kinase
MPRTKIVCTIGPASRGADVLERLVLADMSVARLNLSHGTHAEHAEAIAAIRRLAARHGRPIAVLLDLAGPKIRTGEIASGTVRLESGARFTLTSRAVPGDQREVSITYPELPSDVTPGDRVLLNDGALELEVVATTARDIECRVIVGGPLSAHKGINLPTTSIKGPSLTDKDRRDLVFGIAQDVDYFALSFVRRAADVAAVRTILEGHDCRVPVIAKIEKQEALDHVDDILSVADGIMVARGDLGVEIPLERVPLVQKMLIRRALAAGKPVITATQMLGSMVDNPRPTRAEVADVANAVLDGTDAIMLSEETAKGSYPVEAVAMMARIAADAETGFTFGAWAEELHRRRDAPLPMAVGRAAAELAASIDAACIITFTHSGATARLVARCRPGRPILALTPVAETYRRLALVWGVIPALAERMESTDVMITRALIAARSAGLANKGARVVVTAGAPVDVAGTTNLIRTETVP